MTTKHMFAMFTKCRMPGTGALKSPHSNQKGKQGTIQEAGSFFSFLFVVRNSVVKLDYNLTANMKIDYPLDAVRVEQTSTPH
jgi:hypothetical protein